MSNQWLNKDKCQCECKNIHACEKDCVWNLVTCNCKNRKYSACIMDDSTIIFDEFINSYEEKITDIPSKFDEKKVTCKTQSFYILFDFY